MILQIIAVLIVHTLAVYVNLMLAVVLILLIMNYLASKSYITYLGGTTAMDTAPLTREARKGSLRAKLLMQIMWIYMAINNHSVATLFHVLITSNTIIITFIIYYAIRGIDYMAFGLVPNLVRATHLLLIMVGVFAFDFIGTFGISVIESTFFSKERF